MQSKTMIRGRFYVKSEKQKYLLKKVVINGVEKIVPDYNKPYYEVELEIKGNVVDEK